MDGPTHCRDLDLLCNMHSLEVKNEFWAVTKSRVREVISVLVSSKFISNGGDVSLGRKQIKWEGIECNEGYKRRTGTIPSPYHLLSAQPF